MYIPEESNFNIRYVKLCFRYFERKWLNYLQTVELQNAASDLSLYCLSVTHLRVSMLICVKAAITTAVGGVLKYFSFIFLSFFFVLFFFRENKLAILY